MRITLVKEKKPKNGKCIRITRYISPFALLFDFSGLVALLDLALELGSLVILPS